ncbi:MAG: hypothetical protein KF784_03805 [Fimbriimonadaceae bacterium]|nr:hypothetical protein [Fimbriimonadaceae bacterium]
MDYALQDRLHLQRKSNIAIIIALSLAIVGGLIMAPLAYYGQSPVLAVNASVICYFAAVAWFNGLAYYVASKGYPARHCLLGLFSIVGAIILIFLPDQTKGPNPLPRTLRW